ncbi:MAG: CPBP family intramembrane metalloprotease [Methylococcaceae bacterium]|nr:CPBP family intramembrane metalloprotease [Methylococcaceae bacterium]
MLKKVAISLIPFAMLLCYSVIACFIGYGLFIFFDGAVELRKLISKTTQILLLLSIYPLMRWLKITASGLGFVPFKTFIKQMGLGVLLGLLTLLPILLLSYALGITVVDDSVTWTIAKVLISLLITLLLGVLISFLEEPMFRGILISAYSQRLGIAAAIFVSSFYYAMLHFLKTSTVISVDESKLTDSFTLMFEAFKNVLNPMNVGAFWGLLMVGIFLAVMRSRLQLSLAWCIGCHAAWVWQIKMAHKVVKMNIESDLLYLVSPYDGVVGPMVAMWLTLVLAAYFMYEKMLVSR